MTPGKFTVPIYRGAKWSHTLTMKQKGTVTPVDLTGLGDFVMQFKGSAGNVLASATILSDYDATGTMTVTLTAAQTLAFPIGEAAVTVGLRDAENNPYIEATIPVRKFTPDPA
jgi:hypothetical protein